MRSADATAVQIGIPAQVLMENAGQRVAESAARHWPTATNITVLCGKGNNGGDGYVTARHLLESGNSVKVLELTGKAAALTTEEARQARISLLAHEPSIEALTPQSLSAILTDSELMIDALFGSGLSRPLAGDLAAIVKIANEATVPILSIDVPSGVGSDSPLLMGPHIEAERTLQLAGPKLSSAFYPARAAFGNLEVATIGIPESVLEAQSSTQLLTHQDATLHLPKRAEDVHKYSAGTVAVLAGSPNYLGAAELACRAAYRAGAGLVTLAAESRLAASWPEIVFWPLNWEDKPLEALSTLTEKAAQSLVIGPGLTKRAETFIPTILTDRKVPSVLDASALAPTARLRQAVKNHGRSVLTPHLGEAAHLLGTRVSEVLADPLAAAANLAADWGRGMSWPVCSVPGSPAPSSCTTAAVPRSSCTV
jgi:NAD(P)H-hydrate epimerase